MIRRTATGAGWRRDVAGRAKMWLKPKRLIEVVSFRAESWCLSLVVRPHADLVGGGIQRPLTNWCAYFSWCSHKQRQRWTVARVSGINISIRFSSWGWVCLLVFWRKRGREGRNRNGWRDEGGLLKSSVCTSRLLCWSSITGPLLREETSSCRTDVFTRG